MDFSYLKQLIQKHYPEVLDKPGEVFFGSRASLSNSNGIAIVGLNPGGTGLPSISENLSRYDSGSKISYSGYLDQCWHEPSFSKYETCGRCRISLRNHDIVDQDPHQRRVSRIAEYVGFDLRLTVSMNAIWTQTRSDDELKTLLANQGHKSRDELFRRRYFPVFKEIFDKCRIRLVICLGNGSEGSSFALFAHSLGVERNQIVSLSSKYRDGKFFESKLNGRKTIFFGVAHPSRFDPSELALSELKEKWIALGSPAATSSAPVVAQP